MFYDWLGWHTHSSTLLCYGLSLHFKAGNLCVMQTSMFVVGRECLWCVREEPACSCSHRKVKL